MSFKAGDQLDVAGLTFEWSKEYDNISFEKISIGNVLEENEVEELAEFCISFQNRETPQKELEQKRERLKRELRIFKNYIEDAENKIKYVDEYRKRIEDTEKKLRELDV